MSNKSTGNKYEQDLCKKIAQKGYWCHNFANRSNGQPADIIAVKDSIALLIDAKVCENDTFSTNRIEENQLRAMKKWEQCGNGNGYFCLKTSAGDYVLALNLLLSLKDLIGLTNLNLEDIISFGTPLNELLNRGDIFES